MWAAAIYSLVGTAKLNGLDPEGYLREVLAYFTPSRSRISRDAGPPFHGMSVQHFTHVGPPFLRVGAK